MHIKSQIGRWGNSLAFRIPKHISDELNLQDKDLVICTIEKGKLLIEPSYAQKEYLLDDLLSETIEMSEEVSWGKPEGNETW